MLLCSEPSHLSQTHTQICYVRVNLFQRQTSLLTMQVIKAGQMQVKWRNLYSDVWYIVKVIFSYVDFVLATLWQELKCWITKDTNCDAVGPGKNMSNYSDIPLSTFLLWRWKHVIIICIDALAVFTAEHLKISFKGFSFKWIHTQWSPAISQLWSSIVMQWWVYSKTPSALDMFREIIATNVSSLGANEVKSKEVGLFHLGD